MDCSEGPFKGEKMVVSNYPQVHGMGKMVIVSGKILQISSIFFFFECSVSYMMCFVLVCSNYDWRYYQR